MHKVAHSVQVTPVAALGVLAHELSVTFACLQGRPSAQTIGPFEASLAPEGAGPPKGKAQAFRANCTLRMPKPRLLLMHFGAFMQTLLMLGRQHPLSGRALFGPVHLRNS